MQTSFLHPHIAREATIDAFDIGRLTDADFEAVCKDLFEEILGVRLEIFAPGADGGVDLRHLYDPASSLVIQCKHWIRAGRAALLQHVKKVEAAKVRRLAPHRYVLVASVDLTPAAKAELSSTLAPYLHSESDIYGVREIEAELRARPHLVRRHLRLWLTSAGVLESVLHETLL